MTAPLRYILLCVNPLLSLTYGCLRLNMDCSGTNQLRIIDLTFLGRNPAGVVSDGGRRPGGNRSIKICVNLWRGRVLSDNWSSALTPSLKTLNVAFRTDNRRLDHVILPCGGSTLPSHGEYVGGLSPGVSALPYISAAMITPRSIVLESHSPYSHS